MAYKVTYEVTKVTLHTYDVNELSSAPELLNCKFYGTKKFTWTDIEFRQIISNIRYLVVISIIAINSTINI